MGIYIFRLFRNLDNRRGNCWLCNVFRVFDVISWSHLISSFIPLCYWLGRLNLCWHYCDRVCDTLRFKRYRTSLWLKNSYHLRLSGRSNDWKSLNSLHKLVFLNLWHQCGYRGNIPTLNLLRGNSLLLFSYLNYRRDWHYKLSYVCWLYEVHWREWTIGSFRDILNNNIWYVSLRRRYLCWLYQGRFDDCHIRRYLRRFFLRFCNWSNRLGRNVWG